MEHSNIREALCKMEITVAEKKKQKQSDYNIFVFYKLH